MSKPGKFKEPLEDSDEVIRVGHTNYQSHYNSISPDQFRIDDREKKEEWKRISVYESSLTSDEEAIKLTSPKRLFIIKFIVGELRKVVVNNDNPFDVKWDPRIDCIDENGIKIIGSPKGCEGHAGLEGLYAETKGGREELRVELTSFAEASKNFYLFQQT